jgi:hypothetical protein
MDEWIKSGIHGILLSHKEEWNDVIFRKMEGTGNHHITWNKPDSERWILHFLSYVESSLKKGKLKMHYKMYYKKQTPWCPHVYTTELLSDTIWDMLSKLKPKTTTLQTMPLQA